MGRSGVGKTSYINRLVYGEFSSVQNRTSFHLGTTAGLVCFELIKADVDTEHDGVDAAIYMFDLSGDEHVMDDFRKMNHTIPTIVCQNKFDLRRKAGKSDMCMLIGDVPYYEISTLPCYNIAKPLIAIMRKLIDPTANLLDCDTA